MDPEAAADFKEIERAGKDLSESGKVFRRKTVSEPVGEPVEPAPPKPRRKRAPRKPPRPAPEGSDLEPLGDSLELLAAKQASMKITTLGGGDFHGSLLCGQVLPHNESDIPPRR